MVALAKMAGFTSSSQISRYENGENLPDPYVLLKISEALEIDLHWLITGDDQFQKAAETLVNTDIETIRKPIAEKYQEAWTIILDAEARLSQGEKLSEQDQAALQVINSQKNRLSDLLMMLHNFTEIKFRLNAILEMLRLTQEPQCNNKN